MNDSILKEQLLVSLKGRGAHAPHAAILSRIPAERAAEIPPGLTHSAYQLLEHMRYCIEDILDYCRNPAYRLRKGEEYWVENPPSVSEETWEKARAAYFRALNEMIALVGSGDARLDAKVPSGPEDHTLFREAIIVVDHNAYHCGQLAVIAHAIEAG